MVFFSCTNTPELETVVNPVGFKGLFPDSELTWEKGSTIYITNGSEEGIYQANESGATVEFTKVSGSDLTTGPFTAYFPVDAKDVKIDSIQNGRKMDPGCYFATSDNTILPFMSMAGYISLDIDTQDMTISSISVVSEKSRHEIVPAEDVTLPYNVNLRPGSYDGLTLIIRTKEERSFTIDITSSVNVEAGKGYTLSFSLGNCQEQDAMLDDGPVVGDVLRSAGAGMERLVITVNSETVSNTTISSKVSRTPIYFKYDAGTKTGEIHTLAPVIRAGKTISSLFSGLDKLKSIEGLPVISTERVEDFSSMFKNCSALEEIDLSGFITTKALNMASMFEGCSSLTDLDCGTFDVRKVTNMRSIFAHCSSIENLDIDNLETYSMTDGSFMFYKCSALKKLSAAGLYSLNLVQNCSALFYGDVNLEEIFLGANFYGAEYDLDGVLACEKDTPFEERLASVPGKLDIYCARSVATALAKSSLRWLNSGFEGSRPIPVTFFQDRFGLEGPSLDTLKRIVWPSDIPDSYLPDGKDLNLSSKTLVNGSTVSATTTNAAAVKSIEFLTNVDMSQITSGKDVSLYGDGMIVATFKDGVLRYNTSCDNYIATASLDYMFDTYKNVKTIKGLEKINIEKVTSASYMFNDCVSLDSLDLSTFAFPEVTSLKYMFNNCSSLRYLDISNLERVKATTIQYMFNGTVSLKTLHIDNFPNKWTYASYNQNFQGESAQTMLGANATSASPCEIWTKVANHIKLMIEDQEKTSTDWTHSSIMRKQYMDGKIIFRYPGRTDPWTIVCTEEKFTSATIPSK